jgi:hypothetical protein
MLAELIYSGIALTALSVNQFVTSKEAKKEKDGGN